MLFFRSHLWMTCWRAEQNSKSNEPEAHSIRKFCSFGSRVYACTLYLGTRRRNGVLGALENTAVLRLFSTTNLARIAPIHDESSIDCSVVELLWMVLCNQSEIALHEKRPPTAFRCGSFSWVCVRACVCVCVFLISISKGTRNDRRFFYFFISPKWTIPPSRLSSDAIKLMRNLGDHPKIEIKWKWWGMQVLVLTVHPKLCQSSRTACAISLEPSRITRPTTTAAEGFKYLIKYIFRLRIPNTSLDILRITSWHIRPSDKSLVRSVFEPRAFRMESLSEKKTTKKDLHHTRRLEADYVFAMNSPFCKPRRRRHSVRT